MLTIIVAQTSEDDVINKDDLPPGPSEIPLADDDVETEETAQQPFQPLPAEVPQGQPGVEPIPGLEGEALEPAGEIPAPEPPPKPEDEFEKMEVEPSELDVLNQTLSIQQKVMRSISDGTPLRIIYTTLAGHSTERTVEPDYIHSAVTTGNRILIAWDHLRNGWRGFILDRIRAAKLEGIA